jgi:Ni/Co efflux regulator RcnB
MTVDKGRIAFAAVLALAVLATAGVASAQCKGKDCPPAAKAPPPRSNAPPPRAYAPAPRAYAAPQRPAAPPAGGYGTQRPAYEGGAAPYARSPATGGRPAFSQARRFSYHGRSAPAFRAAPYRYPRGYGYRQYRQGERFPLALLVGPYFITDFSVYGLAPPGPSLEWVRYGPDALLVDTYTGQVVDVAYGVFDEDPGDAGGYPPPGYDDQGYPPPDGQNGYPPPPVGAPPQGYPPPPPPPADAPQA